MLTGDTFFSFFSICFLNFKKRIVAMLNLSLFNDKYTYERIRGSWFLKNFI